LNEPKKYFPFEPQKVVDLFRREHSDFEIQTFTVLHCVRYGFKTISYIPQESIILGQIISFIHQFSSIVSLTGDTEISSNQILLLS